MYNKKKIMSLILAGIMGSGSCLPVMADKSDNEDAAIGESGTSSEVIEAGKRGRDATTEEVEEGVAPPEKKMKEMQEELAAQERKIKELEMKCKDLENKKRSQQQSQPPQMMQFQQYIIQQPQQMMPIQQYPFGNVAGYLPMYNGAASQSQYLFGNVAACQPMYNGAASQPQYLFGNVAACQPMYNGAASQPQYLFGNVAGYQPMYNGAASQSQYLFGNVAGYQPMYNGAACQSQYLFGNVAGYQPMYNGAASQPPVIKIPPEQQQSSRNTMGQQPERGGVQNQPPVIEIPSTPQPNQEHVVIEIPSTPQPNQEQVNEGAANKEADAEVVANEGAANREADDANREESSDDDDSILGIIPEYISVAERENLDWINSAYRCKSSVLDIDAFNKGKFINDCKTLKEEKGIDLEGISTERMLTIGVIHNKFNGYTVFEDYEKMYEIFEDKKLENMNQYKRERFEMMKQQTSEDADEIVNVLLSDEEIFTSVHAYVTALLANKLISSDMYVEHDLKDALERALTRTEERLGSQPYGRVMICICKE